MASSSLNRVFNLPPEEIIKYFESKGLKTSFDWHEVYADAHARAFSVAKMTDIELLSDTKKLLEKALKEGKSYSSFKKEAQELFNKKGWTGFKEIKDPKTGETKTVELGTPSRIKKIYDCNMRSAYAVGRYREQLEEIDVAPYLQYVAILDESTRPQHRELNGKVFKADDPFWQNFYPPNGWNCRCYVRSLTKHQLEKAGLKVENSEGHIKTVSQKVGDEIKEIPTYHYENVGKVYTLKPDAGWETNLGLDDWWLDVQAWKKAQKLSPAIQEMFIQKTMDATKSNFKNMIETVIANNFKTNKKKEKTVSWIKPATFGKINKEIDLIDPIIVLQEPTIPHVIGNRNKLTPDEIKLAYDIFQNPDEIYWDYTKRKSGEIGIVYIRRISDKDCIKVCVKLARKSKATKEIVNYISTMGKVKKNDLLDPILYKKIE